MTEHITHNDSWEAQSEAKIDLVLREIMAWGAALGRDGELPPLPGQATLLRDLYTQALPLARLLDRSQLVLHAEGPGANHESPWLSSFRWLADTSQKVLRHIAHGWLDSVGADGRALARKVDWRISGMAPGSIWLGIRAQAPDQDLLPQDTELIEQLGTLMGRLPLAGRYIDDEGLRAGVNEAFEDPAQLDVMLDALYRLSPTGRAGIHSLGLSAPKYGMVTISQRERVVIAEVLKRPKSQQILKGRFVGEIRLIDLDKHRATLRTKDGAIRCALHGLRADTARDILGRAVQVEGAYESDRNGRPRMLYVETIAPAPQQTGIAP
jgi:predicted RNA-binding protein